jgi:DNA-binding NtrC family response regulator
MKKILLLDDDRNVLDTIATVLKERSYNVSSFDCPFEALALLRDDPKRFDLLILDWKLKSSLDGDAFFKLIQKVSNFDTPIIFLTRHTQAVSKTLIHLGAFDTLKKPVKIETLVLAIERALGTKPPEDPHQHVPSEINWQKLKLHEMTNELIEAIHSSSSLSDAARKLNCSRKNLYAKLREANLYHFFIKKERLLNGNVPNEL